jgi:dipeptidyl aminopeptidase/acylaminoacyl peptidase
LSSPDPKNDYIPRDWSPDGASLLYWEGDNTKALGYFGVYPLTGDSKPYRLFEELPSNIPDARFSPDGKWIAFTSDQSGHSEIYIAPFGRPGVPVQISTNGGQNARWMPDGNHLLYMATDHQVITVPLELGATVQAGERGRCSGCHLPPQTALWSLMLHAMAKDFCWRCRLDAPVRRSP